MNIDEIRKDFPIVENRIFLNHAGISPLPRPVIEAIRRYLDESPRLGTYKIDLDECKRLFADLIGAKLEEIAATPNASTGINIVANMLSYPPEANIVTTDLEYPAVVYPWLRKKVEVRYVKNINGRLLIEDFEKLIDDNTVIVAISHVEYANGFRNDIKAIAQIAHEHGALIMVDAIQSLGALKVDVKRSDIDFLATSCYKWLLAPSGIGFLYIKEDLIEKFEPTFVGCAGVKPEIFETSNLWNNRELILRRDAGRFEVSWPGDIPLIGVMAALRMILGFGIDWIEGRVLRLTGFLMDGLEDLGLRLQTPREDEERSGIVNFLVDDPDEMVKLLRGKGIIVSARGCGVRVSPHFYNTEEEIRILIDVLKDLLRG